ncbi:MAG TPA: hypothetical protein VE086_02470 [Chthoniobacterales bacterium]|nr:hypothetical protein [Chthoniobacterales bacterium]
MNALGKLIGIVAAILVMGRVGYAASASITQAEAETFINSFYHAMEQGDLDKIMTHFDRKVEYYDSGLKDQDYIANELQQYCSAYPSRSFSIGAIRLKPLPNSDTVTVNFDIRFFLRNPEQDANKSGRSHVEWDLVKSDGKVRIIRFSGSLVTEPAAAPH